MEQTYPYNFEFEYERINFITKFIIQYTEKYDDVDLAARNAKRVWEKYINPQPISEKD